MLWAKREPSSNVEDKAFALIAQEIVSMRKSVLGGLARPRTRPHRRSLLVVRRLLNCSA
jgi:hypothetical protein